MIFPISKAKYNLLKIVYESFNIRISDLLKKAKVSQKIGYRYINELLDAKIISQKIEPPLRIIKPEFSVTGKIIFSLIEEEKRLKFLEKHKELKGPFFQFENEVSDYISCALVFGSFSRYSETKESDLDLLIIAETQTRKKVEKAVENCFITIKNKPSIRFVTKENFIDALRKEDGFAKQILKDHIVLVNSCNWVELISGIKLFV
ncbi:MAG: nucleotidyltransferase domain-containing protein [Candidatus Pacearchaeota archaeon]|nr:nucleotidyltransferase domain-containing protein [Candidatus Pacearchaeota archaeon]